MSPYADPEARREHQRRYRAANREKIAEYTRQWHADRYANNPDYREKVKADARARYDPAAGRARYAVRMAVARGEMTKPAQCSECGGNHGRIEASHANYSRPLEIRWLCSYCHRSEDARAPKGGTKKL